jgi:glutamate---cysteine ligase / carboxylate-amine ligase
VSFGSGEPFSLGVEEELLLADPVTGALRNAGAAVLDRLGELRGGEVKGEVHACQVELITGVHRTVADAIGELRDLRRAVAATGIGLIGSGTHPTAAEGAAEITDQERYEFIRSRLGDAIADPVSALHVHVGMPDAETAIRVFNGLRRHLPLLEALGANSPFRHGRDTGLASAREITLRAWPRSGVLRELRDYADFEQATARLTEVAEVPDYTFHWWKLRPHPRLGTVEIRALDVQAQPDHTAPLVAAVHALAHHVAHAEPVPGPSVEVLEEASFRAARFGVIATLPDRDGRLRPVAELLRDVVAEARPSARELGGEDELESLPKLAGGAALQRAAHARGGFDEVLRELLAAA